MSRGASSSGQSSILNYFGAADPAPLKASDCQRVNVDLLGPTCWVLRHAIGKEVKSWSKVYVPLIYSALGTVPAAVVACMALSSKQRAATAADVARAQGWWQARFSQWPAWVAAVRRVVSAEGGDAPFAAHLLLSPRPKGKTTLVFGDGAGFGWLPHPPGRNQERIMAMAEIDGEIATCIAFSTGPAMAT